VTRKHKSLSWKQRRRRTREQVLASSLIDRVLASYGVESEVREHRIVLDWKSVVGERVARRTWPDGLREGILWVRVANSAWMQELTFLRPTMIERANALVGHPPLVRDVRLHVGARKQSDADDVVATLASRVMMRRKPRRWNPPPATGAALERIETETADVEDDDLRQVIREARIKLGV